jgi:hypothetical protein
VGLGGDGGAAALALGDALVGGRDGRGHEVIVGRFAAGGPIKACKKKPARKNARLEANS